MIIIAGHSTGCCGASSGYGFGSYKPTEAQVKAFDSSVNNQCGRGGHLIEFMLTDSQMRNWAPILKERGFEVLRRWRNRNTGNYCNLVVKAPKTTTQPPYEW